MRMTSESAAFQSAPGELGGGGANFATLKAPQELITRGGVYASTPQINPTALP